MRIRTIKPEFFTHDRLFEAEIQHKMPLRIAFAGLWCAADREGRFKWEPRRLGVQILPYDNIEFSRVLDALVTRGFIIKYATATGEFGCIPGFARHQVVNNKERASELPEPILDKDSNACLTRESRDSDACHKEGKGKEQGKDTPIVPKGTRKKESGVPTSPEAIALAEMFHRKATTPWTAVEIRKFKSLMPIDPDDLKSLKEYYDDNWPPERDVNVLRHDLKTLLNNFPGEVGRAKVWESKPIQTNPYSVAPLYPTNRNGSLFA